MNNSIWNTCIGEAIRKAKLSGTLIPSNEVDEIISELEKLKRTTPKEPETVQGNDEKGVTDNFIPPDHGDMCWQIGAKNFSRKEVAYLLYTQRAMIGNDLKAFCGNEMTDEMFKILSNPRTPNY